MAESAVIFLLKKIMPMLEQEWTLLTGVRGEVRYIKDELESMRAFLRVADARCESDEELKVWVKQVRDVAYETEDVLDVFLLRLAQHGHGFLASLGKIAHNIMTLKARYQIATDIQDIGTRVKEISDRSQRYRHGSQDQGSSSASINNTWHDPRGDALLLEEADLVGIGKPRDNLIGLLTNEEPRLGVVAVVGMGGLGKTTLVKKVFDDPKVKRRFNHQVLITVSQTFKVEELLKDMINKLFNSTMQPPQGFDTMNETTLKGVLRDFLRLKRYLVVLDDIWNIHAWEALKYALPDNNSSSQVVVTIRYTNVASSCTKCNGHLYHLNSLQQQEAWALFCKKAFPSNKKHKCPPQLEKISPEILKRCQGLPIAIVAIGGLLSTKNLTDGLGYYIPQSWCRVREG